MPQRFKVQEGSYPHFITSSVVHWIPAFNRLDYFQILADSFIYCIEKKGLVVHANVFMPNHFHAICSQTDGRLSDAIRDLKRFTSRQVTEQLERDGRGIWLRAMQRAAGNRDGARLWDEAFHPEQICSEAFFKQKLDYLHDNPVRAGFVDDPSDWKHSSAGFYYRDQPSIIPITPIEW